MRSIASEILAGMTREEIDEAAAPSISSARSCFYPKGVFIRNARAAAGKIVGPEDLNEKRKFLRENIPIALKKERGVQ